MKARARISSLAALLLAGAALIWPAGPALAQAGAGSVDKVDFEITPEEVTVVIRTSAPVPRYECTWSGVPGDTVTLAFPGAASRLETGYDSPVPLLGPIETQAHLHGGDPGTLVRIHPVRSRLVGVSQRPEGVALAFKAAKGASEASDYRIGVGDKLDVAVFGQDDLTRTVEVHEDGTITFPLIGDVRVAGLTTGQVEEELVRRLGSEYLVDPEVSVEVREYRSQWVTLMGEVRTPGRYALKRDMRLIDLLADAGGPTKEAGSEIVVNRHGEKDAAARKIVVSLDKLFGHDVSDSNIRLRDGDVVTVGERSYFYVRGEVARPAPYFFDPGITVLKAISIAGGLTQFANRKDVQILRPRENGMQEKINVNLKSIEDGKDKDVPLQADDVVIVPRRIF